MIFAILGAFTIGIGFYCYKLGQIDGFTEGMDAASDMLDLEINKNKDDYE